MPDKYRIFLADDHVLFRQCVMAIIEDAPGYKVTGEAGDGLELLRLLRTSSPHLVILDISMPKLGGIEAISEIKKELPAVKVLVLTMHCNTKYLQQAITSGADGYLLKDDAERELFSAIERVRNNGKYVSPCMVDDLINDWANLRSRGAQDAPNPEILTLREKEVLKLIAEGRSSREIADMLFLSVRTIDRHRENIADKLRIRKAADLVKYAVHNGYV